MDKTLIVILMLVCVRFCVVKTAVTLTRPSYSTDLETALRNELFTTGNYVVLQRPQNTVPVMVSLTLLTVNELNIKDQVLSVSGYLSLDWTDSRLDWSNTSATTQDYSNVKFLFSTETYVWRPAIIIENSVEDISVISDKHIPMRITSVGGISWNPSGIYKVACESDISYYPMDSQSCTIKVSTWGYTSTEIYLYFASEPVDLGFYGENGEWELISATSSGSTSKSRGGQSFSSLSFSINLRRRPLFHILNTMFPVVLMAFLIPMVYRLPADSGEKIGYSLTVLLAYAVYLTLISDNIPSTSVTVCYLSIYLALTLAEGTLSVNFVILVLSLHHVGDKKIPKWLQKVNNCFIARFACWGSYCCCFKCEKNQKNEVQVVSPITEKPTMKGHAILPEIAFQEDDVEMEEEITYQEFAAILDRFLFVLYMMIILISTLIFTVILGVHYTSL